MKCCTFCSNEAQMLFSHPTYDMGSFCMECYMKFQGACGACGVSFLPDEVLPDVNYQIGAKFIGMGGKNYVICEHCFEMISREFPDQFG